MADHPPSDPAPDPTIPSSSSSSAAVALNPATLLLRAASFSKLNATAPEFVPSPRGTGGGDSRIVITPPLPPPPPPPPTTTARGIVHVYEGAHGQGFSTPMMQNHHHHFQQNYNHHNNHNHNHQQNYQRNHHQHGNSQKKHRNHEQEGTVQSEKDHGSSAAGLRNGVTEEVAQKIINQVEYYFSDVNLATTDHLIKFINKDPEGYVPISVVASFKKIKAHISTNSQLAAVLRDSKKLVVSDDGKKVKRLLPLTGSDMEELQARIIIAENLPEDHCHQNLMKIFSSVGSVKSIRTCQPQASNNAGPAASRSSKQESMLYSDKLCAFVEYDNIELAEKAVAELNDEGNWRNGLRVRLLRKPTSKSVPARGRKVGNEGKENCDEDGTSISERGQSEKQGEDSSRQSDFHSFENLGEEHGGEKEGVQKKGRNRGRGGKGRGRGHPNQANRPGAHVGTLTSNPAISEPASSIVKHHHPPGPRMPDGTRGFAMGRGKPLLVKTA